MMHKLLIVQTDNRLDLHYLQLSRNINKQTPFDYLFIEMNDDNRKDVHPATAKIYIINNLLDDNKYDYILFLDSDAWIQNLNGLIALLDYISKNNINGVYSRDPYSEINTFINAGGFILKNNDYIKNMYKELIAELSLNKEYHHKWPYDQYYISKYIFKNKIDFLILNDNIINTPDGIIIRHNWWKNDKMINDMNIIIEDLKRGIIYNWYIDISKLINKSFNVIKRKYIWDINKINDRNYIYFVDHKEHNSNILEINVLI